MEKFAQRTIWTSVWIVAMAITAWLCFDLVQQQPVIMAVILMAAFIVSIGPPYARQTWQNGAKGIKRERRVAEVLGDVARGFDRRAVSR